jgi:RNA recognition motif-containing protein
MGRKLFVGNLNYQTTGDDLKELFSQFGTCESAAVMFDRATGRSRGFGFVEMSSDEEASRAATELNGKDFQGRSLNVNEARERTPGGGGPGRFRGPDRGSDWRPSGPSEANFGGGNPFESGGFGSSWGGGGGRGPKKPFKEGGSRRGLRARKRSL